MSVRRLKVAQRLAEWIGLTVAIMDEEIDRTNWQLPETVQRRLRELSSLLRDISHEVSQLAADLNTRKETQIRGARERKTKP